MTHALTPLRVVAAVLCLAAAPAQAAAPVLPTHYELLNGYGMTGGGSFNYWDKKYSGSGNSSQDYAPLSGGLGDLTDGIIATENWHLVENVEGTGPYVGWNKGEPWLITFHFGQVQAFNTVTVWHDDPDGLGDIAPPAAFTVTVGGNTQRFEISDLPGAVPTFSVLTLAPGTVGSSLVLGVERFNNGVMLSEVQFTSAVPEPASSLLLGLGLGLTAWARRNRREV
ncbi:MAG: PEP-CTERM sorting domain-containing protein [Burkholderiales bacterium]|nr:PEP-CTERM sorting domain-containing protein [Burkholderiales bacterium]